MKGEFPIRFVPAAVVAAFLFVLVLALGIPEGEEPLCAAVHPCNPDGSVYAPFNQGACAERYALECARQLADEKDLSALFNQCVADREHLARRTQKLKRRNRQCEKRKSVCAGS